MNPPKRFFLACITDLRKHRLPLNWKKLEELKKLFLHKHASSFLKGIFNKFWRCIKSRCLPGVLFFARFSTWEENLLRQNCDLFYPKLAKRFGFQIDVRSLSEKNQKTPKRSSRLLKSSFDKPADYFRPKIGIIFLEVRNENEKKLIKKYFFLKAFFCTRSRHFRQLFQKLCPKIRCFFLREVGRNFQKNVSFVEQRLF